MIFLFAWLIGGSPLPADIVRLKSGEIIEGTLQSGRADPIVIRTKTGVLSFPAKDVLDTKILLSAPLACLRRMSGTQLCGQPIARVSSVSMDVLELDTGAVERKSWSEFIELTFTELPSVEVLEIAQTPLLVEVESPDGRLYSGILEKSGAAGLIRTETGMLPLPPFARRFTVRKEPASRSALRMGLFLPGYEQWQNGQRLPALLLSGGTLLCTGLAAWSYAEAERARKTKTTGVVPLGGFLGTISGAEKKRFRQSQLLNHVALGGLATVFIANAAHLRFFSPGGQAAAGRMELGFTIRF